MNTFLDWLSSVLVLIIIIGAFGLCWNGFAPALFNLPYMTWKESISMSGFVYILSIFWNILKEG